MASSGRGKKMQDGGIVSRETSDAPEGTGHWIARLGSRAMAPVTSAYDAYQQFIGKPFAGVAGPFAAGYLGLDRPSFGSEEAYRTGQTMGNMPGTGAPAGIFKAAAQAPEALGIFIGKTSGLWDKSLNSIARKMEKQGASPEEIWSKTGNFKGPDKEWRQEISDLGAVHRPQVAQGPASMVFKHPELYQSYPSLKDVFVKTDPTTTRSYYRGAGVPGEEMIMLGTGGGKAENVRGMIHEMSHAIQFRERFGRGGDQQMAFSNPEAHKILAQLRKNMEKPATLEEYARQAHQTDAITPDILKAYQKYVSDHPKRVRAADLDAQKTAAELYYDRLLGEAEARAAELRWLFSPEQRRATIPSKSYLEQSGRPISRDDLIVKREHGGPVNKHDAFIKANS